MRQREVFPYYRKCCDELERVYEIIQEHFTPGYTDELMAIRGYVGQEQRDEIERSNFGHAIILPELLGGMAKELGLVSEGYNFLLNGRYIIPVYDVAGRLSALIGYYPDVKKYVTTPSPFFSKEVMLFNFNEAYEISYDKYNGAVILVEGIFDCVSLRALGLPAVATMGATVSTQKGELLKVFRKVIAIPDNDATGRKSINRLDKRRGWQVPSTATMIRLHGEMDFGSEKKTIKDCDNIVSWFDADSVREMFADMFKLKEDIYDLRL